MVNVQLPMVKYSEQPDWSLTREIRSRSVQREQCFPVFDIVPHRQQLGLYFHRIPFVIGLVRRLPTQDIVSEVARRRRKAEASF